MNKRIASCTVGIALAAAILLGACTKPVPPEKSAYVGEWRSKSMFLMIAQDGSLKYVREKAGSTTKINAPVKEFDGNNIIVGIGPATTTFVVSKPPFQDDGKWKMVVDDELLVKLSE